MECEPIAEPPGPMLPVPTGWWPEPDTIGWVVRAEGPDGPDDLDGPGGPGGPDDEDPPDGVPG